MLRTQKKKDQSGKIEAVSAVLNQVSMEMLKASDEEALRKFQALVHHWAELAAAELEARAGRR